MPPSIGGRFLGCRRGVFAVLRKPVEVSSVSAPLL
jgi:hypothetical protein